MKENCTCNLILKKLFQIFLLHENKLVYNKEVASVDLNKNCYGLKIYHREILKRRRLATPKIFHF